MDPRLSGDGDFWKPKKLFDSPPAQVTPRSVRQFWISANLFCQYLRENEPFSKPILSCLSGAQVA